MTKASVLLPDSTGFSEAAASFSLLRTPVPARIVVATDIDAVRSAVEVAAESGLRVAAFTTGHAAGRLGALHDALLIRVALDEPVTIDPEARTARIPAGALWRDVVTAAAAHGLLAPHGSSGTVGAVGYLLNGGLGFTGRAVGVAANSVTAVEYVDAEARMHRADPDHEPERFWALRGGGAGVGVVTAIEVRLLPGATVFTGAAMFGAAEAGRLLRAWRDWCGDAPRGVTTCARVLNLPPLPHLPPFLTSGPVVAIDGVALDDGRDSTEVLIGALSAIAEPLISTWHPGGAVDALAAHMDPEDPSPSWTEHDLLGALPDEAIDAFVAASTGPSPLVSHELRQLGGAFAEPDEPGGFFDRVPEPFLFNGVAIAPAPDALAAARAHVAALRHRIDGIVHGRCVPTFLEAADDDRLAADEVRMDRLRRIRADADPVGRFAIRP